MLNLFPIQFLALLAYFILRAFVGGMLLYFGFSHIKSRETISELFTFPFFSFGAFSTWFFITVEIILSFMFLTGFLTQIAALGVIIMSIKMIILTTIKPNAVLGNRTLYVLLLGCALSLFITGAGAFAFDLPI